MLGYAKENASGTYRILNLNKSKIIKSRNIRQIKQSYADYKRSIYNIVDDTDSGDSKSEEDTQNQGAIPSSPSKKHKSTYKKVSKLEGSIDPISARTRSKSKVQTGTLAQDLNDLNILGSQFLSEKQRLFASKSMLSTDEVEHALISIVGGT